MGHNPVLSSTRQLVEEPSQVFIDHNSLEALSHTYAKEEFIYPTYQTPFYPEEDPKAVIDYLILVNTLNFAFTSFVTGERYATTYQDKDWTGFYALEASLARGLEEGYPLLHGSYLRSLTAPELGHILRGSPEIPMLEQRLEVLNQTGRILEEKYGGLFHNIVELSGRKLFDQGSGFVERLTQDFPSFDDSVIYKGRIIRFDKRAQLAAAMLLGRFQESPLFEPEEADLLTVFADYELPKTLRYLGVLEYSPELSYKVDNHQLIPSGSLEELEIRASTIHACNLIIEELNHLQFNHINAIQLDNRLWKAGRRLPGPHHLTMTIMY